MSQFWLILNWIDFKIKSKLGQFWSIKGRNRVSTGQFRADWGSVRVNLGSKMGRFSSKYLPDTFITAIVTFYEPFFRRYFFIMSKIIVFEFRSHRLQGLKFRPTSVVDFKVFKSSEFLQKSDSPTASIFSLVKIKY